MTQPLDRSVKIPQIGDLDQATGEFWRENTFEMGKGEDNLSAYENNRLYLNIDGKRFLDCSFGSGCDIDSDSRSVAVADVNRDGLPDLLVGSVGGGPLRLFANQFPDKHHSVRLNLAGAESNRSGIGSRVTVTVGNRKIIRDLFPANGCLGQGPAELLVGLGKAERIDRLDIRWPNGLTQTLTDLPVDGVLIVNEGKSNFGFSSFGGVPASSGSKLKKFAAIDTPRWAPAANSPLAPDEPVLGLAARGTVHAYPVRYMQEHHLCHDEVAGVPVLISYSPHAKSGTAFLRMLSGSEKKLTLTFEVAGMMQAVGYAVLRDQQTQSLWNPLTGQCIKGRLKGTTLKRAPLFTTSMAAWQQLNRSSDVLQPELDVDYPEVTSDNSDSGSKFVKNIRDACEPDALGIGIRNADQQLFVPLEELARFDGGFLFGKLGERRIVVLYDEQNSAVSCYYAVTNKGNQAIELSREKSRNGQFVTTDGSVFDMLGRCRSGPAKGSRLTSVVDTAVVRWYAWSVTNPKTYVVKRPK